MDPLQGGGISFLARGKGEKSDPSRGEGGNDRIGRLTLLRGKEEVREGTHSISSGGSIRRGYPLEGRKSASHTKCSPEHRPFL